MKLSLLIVLILASNLFAFGQIISNNIRGEEVYLKNNKTFAQYDSAKDQTTVYSPHILLYKSEGSLNNLGELISANFLFSHQGRMLTSTPNIIELKFISHVNHLWKFKDVVARQLIINVDGKPLIDVTLERVSAQQFPDINFARMRFVEVLATPLSFENFSKIKNGTKVVLQIGKAYKYKLSKNDFKMIDDFVSQRIPVNP